jgi:hypothetical protein
MVSTGASDPADLLARPAAESATAPASTAATQNSPSGAKRRRGERARLRISGWAERLCIDFSWEHCQAQ